MGGEKTREWLVNGILAGHSTDVRVRLRGDLREVFRSPIPAGGVQRRGPDRARICAVPEGWPRIENIQGELLFERERMQIAGRSGSILGAALANVEARIPRLRDPSPQLEVSGDARGATAVSSSSSRRARCAA